MTIKRRIFEAYANLVVRVNLRLKARYISFECQQYRYTPLCLVTIAFNNVFLIEQQIRLLKKNIKDDFLYIIADNSQHQATRQQIRELCRREEVEYISLPFNWFQRVAYKPSYAHGLSMTWIFHNIIKKVKPIHFAYLDHDIFPISPYSFKQRIGDMPFFGRLMDRTPKHCKHKLWYLWAGFCMFSFDFVEKINLSFLPCKEDGVYLDTAGALYRSLYRQHCLDASLLATPVKEEYFRDGNDFHSDLLHYIDNCWVHTINGSNWKKVATKDDFLKDFLLKY